MERAETFYKRKVLLKSFSVFKEIHARWHYPPEEKQQIVEDYLYQKQLLDKRKLMNAWYVVTNEILIPERHKREKAENFHKIMLWQKTFSAFNEVGFQFNQAEKTANQL